MLPAARGAEGGASRGWCLSQSAGDASHTLVGSIASVIDARAEPERLKACIAASTTQLVTLTITEKGYTYDAAMGQLDTNDPDVQSDLQSLLQPATALGRLLAGLQLRFALGHGGLTVISCDNLSHNGDITKRMLLTLAKHHDTSLASWIASAVSFPNAMVDRIAPAMTPAKFADVAMVLGFEDEAAVVTEKFSQWVIEDKFAGAYCLALVQRFANPHLQHALLQIATDSSQKLPQRILAPLAEQLAAGGQVNVLTHVVAAWMCIQSGISQAQKPLCFSDPVQPALAKQLARVIDCYKARADLIIDAYPPLQDLANRFPTWRDDLERCYQNLHSCSDLSIGDASL